MIIALFALLAGSAPPGLVLPMRCTIGADCLVQKLVDLDPGPGRRDYRCGTLTTDGHDGIDLRLRDIAAMAQGVPVLAAANGTVLRVRDGEADAHVRQRGVVVGREAGNGVLIDHGGGWQTQYSHLRRGSIRVRPGQTVRAGEAIGLVGMSGDTEYPHMHFTVRHDGKAIDPFGGVAGAACGKPGPAVWSAAAAAKLAYTPTALVTAGFAPARPDAETARAGGYAGQSLNRAEPLVMWVDAIGVRAGDVQRVSIAAPDGSAAFRADTAVTSGGLSWFGFSGKKPPAGGWTPGRYRGRFAIVRNGAVVAMREAEATVE